MVATASGLAAKLPPSVRDFDIFRFVKVECRSTRAAAREFGLSQTRIRQIVAEVRDYFLAAVAGRAPEGDDEPDTRLVVAEQLAHEQLEYLYARAVRAFNETEREDVHGNVQPGKASYLLAAARITLWMARVPVHSLPALREEDSDGAGDPTAELRAGNCHDGQSSAAELAAQAHQHETLARAMARAAAIRAALEGADGKSIPLVGECSPDEVSSGLMGAIEVQRIGATDCKDGLSGDTPVASTGPKAAALLTAQASNAATNLPPRVVGERELPSADEMGGRPLNRRERRAREKLRKRLLSKAK